MQKHTAKPPRPEVNCTGNRVDNRAFDIEHPPLVIGDSQARPPDSPHNRRPPA